MEIKEGQLCILMGTWHVLMMAQEDPLVDNECSYTPSQLLMAVLNKFLGTAEGVLGIPDQ